MTLIRYARLLTGCKDAHRLENIIASMMREAATQTAIDVALSPTSDACMFGASSLLELPGDEVIEGLEQFEINGFIFFL